MRILYRNERGILISARVINACANDKGTVFFEVEDLHGGKLMVTVRYEEAADAELTVRTLFQTGMFDLSGISDLLTIGAV